MSQALLDDPERSHIGKTTSSFQVAQPYTYVASHDYCTALCCKRWWLFVGVMVLCMTAATLVLAVAPFTFFVAGIVPAAVLLVAMRLLYEPHVIWCQMLITFFECEGYMLLLVLLLIGIKHIKVYPFDTSDVSKGDCSRCIGGYAFNAYVIAGTLEEIVKFLPVRRIVYSQIVQNPRALWVYGVCSGAGFAAFENVLYVASGGLQAAIFRAITAVPMHCATGFMVGLSLSQMRFLKQDWMWWPVVVLPCIVVHGTYDFVLFTSAGIGGSMGWLALIAVFVLIVTVLVVRQRVVALETAFPLTGAREEHVGKMIEDHRLEPPCPCCVPSCICCFK